MPLDQGGYLVVFASEKDRRDPLSELHTNFKLDGDGEYLAVVRPDGSTIEHEYAPSYPKQKEDVSCGIVLETEILLSAGAEARALVPSNDSLGDSWTDPRFVPDGSWASGTTGVGFNIDNVEIAGELLVDIDAADLPVGLPVTEWSNFGALGGSFNLALTSTPGYAPIAQEADFGAGPARFVTTNEIILMQLRDESGSQIDAPPEITTGSDYTVESWVNLNPAQVGGENTFFAWGRRCCDVAQFDYGDSWGSGAYVSWANVDVGWLGNCGGLPIMQSGLNEPTYSGLDFLISIELTGIEDQYDSGISPAAVEYAGPIALTRNTVITARVLGDHEWGVLNQAYFQLSNSSPGDVIITELLPNANGNDDYKEWFEVYNTTQLPINVNGWVISDNSTDSHTIDNGGPLFVPPKGYLVLGESADPGLNGGAPVDYAYGPDAFTLGNGGDEIILSQNGIVICAVGYEDFPNSPIPVTDVGLDAVPGFAIGMASDYCSRAATIWQVQTSVYGTNGDTGTPGADNDNVVVCAPPDPTMVESWDIYR